MSRPTSEIAIDYHRDSQGQFVPHLIVTLETLCQLLLEESGKIAEEDVPGLIANLCQEAYARGLGDPALAVELRDSFRERAYCGDCEHALCIGDEDMESSAGN